MDWTCLSGTRSRCSTAPPRRALWADLHGDPLLESALLSGAKDWSWHGHSWGVVLELEFADVKAWEAWRALPHVQAALDGVPDPVSGLIVYRGPRRQQRFLPAPAAPAHAWQRCRRPAPALAMGPRGPLRPPVPARGLLAASGWPPCWATGCRTLALSLLSLDPAVPGLDVEVHEKRGVVRR